MIEQALLAVLNDVAQSMGGTVVLEDNLYKVKYRNRVMYEHQQAEQVAAWLDFRAKLGIPLNAKRSKTRRTRRKR